MNVNSYSSNTFRLTGLATGLDTEQMVSSLMRVERMPLDRLYQQKQLSEWKRDSYREITNLLRSFKSEFMDVLKPSTNILSPSYYKQLKATSSNTAVVTATGTSSASAGTHSINVSQLATSAENKSSAKISKDIEGATPIADINFSALKGKSFTLNVDGTSRTISIEDDITDAADLISTLQGSIDTAFGSGKVTIKGTTGPDTGNLTFVGAQEGINKISVYSGPSESADAYNLLGFGITGSNNSNRISVSSSLESISSKMETPFTFDVDGKVSLSINGKSFSFDKSTTLSSMMSQINSDSTAKVNMQYDEVTDTIKFIAKNTGSGNTISLSETGSNFLTSVNISDTTFVEGQDAIVTLDGEKLIRSSNSFSVGGVSYTLLKESASVADTETISITQDTDAAFDNITKFVNKYNEVLDTINKKLGEEYDRNYQPLTDEQKDSMNEDDIKKWEDKAKTGLLRNDSMLQGIVSKMRTALYDSVSDLSQTLSGIGITTGTYQDRGKLKIDEFKLRSALENDPEGVMNLFSKQSTSYPSGYRTLESSEKAIRYKEEGLAYRLFDIVEDNISTFRDTNDKKGALIEKAGLVGDSSEFSNMYYEEIYDYNDRIYELTERLNVKENNYYTKFAALETAMSKMNSQADWLTSQLSSM